jgi:hypothetical protein
MGPAAAWADDVAGDGGEVDFFELEMNLADVEA